ncbi:MAG: hypothetical protein IT273_06970 [Chitinophagales bacterium]|nr:hypothetical protein [Chitinophagales bacterium]
MTTEQIEQAFEALTQGLKNVLGRQPDLQALLFLIGVQELGQPGRSFSKEEKQDLMHIGVCHLLCDAGYFIYKGRDDEGWPHYEAQQAMPLDINNLAAQEELLKRHALRYFEIA